MDRNNKKKIIKIIWVPWSGKSFLFEKIKKELPKEINFIEFWQEIEKRLKNIIHEEWIRNKSNAESLIEEILLYNTPSILTYHIIRRDWEKYEKDLWLEELMNSIGYIYIYSHPKNILKRRIADQKNHIRIRVIGNIKQIKDHDQLIRKNMMEL